MAKKKKKGGRPPKYEQWIQGVGLKKVRGWARQGLSDEQIAHNMGIATCTLYAWKKKYEEFSKAIAEEKEVVDMEVENALLKRALGYEYEEKKVKTDDNGEEVTITRKFIAPDVTAQKFWLTNRQKDAWKDRINQEITGNDGEPLTVQFNISRPPKKE